MYVGLLEAASKQGDRRLAARVAARINGLRGRIAKEQIIDLVRCTKVEKVQMLFGQQPADDQQGAAAAAAVEAFAIVMALNYALDKAVAERDKITAAAIAGCSRLLALARRENDPLQARLFGVLVKAAQGTPNFSTIHAMLMQGLRQCQIRHDWDTLAVVYNALLRLYQVTDQWDLMEKLLKNSEFPVETASHNQLARYYYYRARLEAVKLNYPKAGELLEQALQKAPDSKGAANFVLACNKLAVVVKLLTGEVPELALFRSNSGGLGHYYLLARAVRVGDLQAFRQVLSSQEERFVKDRTEGLVLRLHQNVLKAGLKRISAAYSRISIGDVTRKLGLDSDEDCQMIVMKAIRDRVILGTIEGNVLIRKARGSSAGAGAKQSALHHRIGMCQAFIQEAVKAMRFPKPTATGLGDKKVEEALAEPADDLDVDEDMMMMDDDFGF